MKNFLKEANDRWKSETPIFFKKIQKMGKGLGATGAGLVSPSAIPNVHYPSMLVIIGGYLVVAGIVATAIAKFACDDPEQLPAKNVNQQP